VVKDTAVTCRHVADGVYARAGARTNQVEARAVVAEVVGRLRRMAAGGPAHSVGIVTSDAEQQSLIEDLLDEARRDDPSLERFFSDELDEPVLVKNLEGVQGEERDVVIFSLTYGPDATGRVAMNFGPLNRSGGERRLNVAVTRAREGLLVFGGLRPERIDLARTSATGVAHLKRFLAFAEHGARAFATTSSGPLGDFESRHRAAAPRRLPLPGHAPRRFAGGRAPRRRGAPGPAAILLCRQTRNGRRRMTARLALTLALTALLTLGAGAARAQNLRIGLREDPDILDPTLARTFVGRMVFASLCDKLFDINEKLEIVPQLATGYRWDDPKTLVITLREGVRFHDGDAVDAEAVRYSLMRHLTMQGSFRRGEIGSMEAAEVVDPKTVRIRLKQPFAPFVSQLTDRAGMVVSPKAAEAAGRDFGARPVCAGPFRFVERVAQDRIVVERFPNYWDAGRVHANRITYQPIPDSTARLANLQAGALELAEITTPSDVPSIRRDRRLKLSESDELGYQSLTINVGNGGRAQSPVGRDPRVREAFELALDRDAINQVVYEGVYTVTAQGVPPASPYHVAELKPPARNVERARALLREAGVRTPVPVELTVPNNPELRQVGEVMQAMLAEAGFELKINAMEFASSLQAATRGEFETYLIAWSGRVDPDGNTWTFIHSQGPQNDGKYSNPEVDRLLDAAREESDPEKRKALYAQMWRISVGKDHHRVYLWHRKNLIAHTTRLQGLRAVPDGLIRVQGLRLQ
jgi:peptide/nickel transport system substrate-binding protein